MFSRIRASKSHNTNTCCSRKWSLKVQICTLCGIMVCTLMMFMVPSLLAMLQSGQVSPELARYATYIYYKMDTAIAAVLASDVPSYTEREKWEMESTLHGRYWHNTSECSVLSDSHLLFAMRTPKAASTTLEELVFKLAPMNHYMVSKVASVSPGRPGNDPIKYSERARALCEYFSSLNKKAVSVAHIRYLDFEHYHFPTPIYVGTIRDPVLRMQSHYNYDFFGDRPMHVGMKNGKGSKKVLSFVECVEAYMEHRRPRSDSLSGVLPNRTNDRLVTVADAVRFPCMSSKYVNVQLRYYCGMGNLQCKLASTAIEGSLEWALRMAVRNMRRSFRVVLLVEDMANSIALLEKTVPTFFKGAIHAYNSSAEGLHSNTNTNIRSSHNIPHAVYSFLSDLLFYEIQLYNAAKEHLEHNVRICEIRRLV
mmetsp:Transcript_785/g.1304  ORF Transcript_785/g.1304 Transcript_785/m.1304 type:complete len:423 (+) Transcript_785:151-1419(+)